MLKRIWSEYSLWDELKAGAMVYTVILDGERPKVECVSDFSVQEVAEHLKKHKFDESEYFLVMQEQEGEDADESAG